MNPDISVVIPARNAAETITRQLAAVCEQEIEAEFEVVVVDNGSTDETALVVSQAALTWPSIRLVRGPDQPNRSAARNVGIDAALGDLLAFCDADDVVAQGWLAGLVDGLRDNDVVTGSLQRVDHAGQPVNTEGFRGDFRGLTCLSSANFAIRRATLTSVHGFSEDFRHRVDVELSCRLALTGVEIGYVPEARVVYVERARLAQKVRQHYWWAVADVQLQKRYGSQIAFSYSWRNSLKHWIRVGPSIINAALRREDLTPSVLTVATLFGRLVGSIRYRKWAI